LFKVFIKNNFIEDTTGVDDFDEMKEFDIR